MHAGREWQPASAARGGLRAEAGMTQWRGATAGVPPECRRWRRRRRRCHNRRGRLSLAHRARHASDARGAERSEAMDGRSDGRTDGRTSGRMLCRRPRRRSNAPTFPTSSLCLCPLTAEGTPRRATPSRAAVRLGTSKTEGKAQAKAASRRKAVLQPYLCSRPAFLSSKATVSRPR